MLLADANVGKEKRSAAAGRGRPTCGIDASNQEGSHDFESEFRQFDADQDEKDL
jgi:hypothetical protein